MSLVEYDVLRIIGRGTYGEVHLVNHKKDRKQYVIKKMALLKASVRERKAAEQEAKLLSKLRHPNIVSYKDSFESGDGHLYIVMGYAEGGDLYTKLREHRTNKDHLSEQQVVRWLIQICMALQYLHDHRILHRDLKTQNIFLTKNNMIKVGDLGIARVLENSADMATTLIGTPYYMSPELFSNQPYNHKSDVWALGCCIYEMVTLKHAFNAKDMNSLVYKILRGKMPPMPKEYSNTLCELIKCMLNSNPDKRPKVKHILRNPFIKKHIQLFLDESSRRKRSSTRSSSTVSSAPSSRSASRKSSVNSQGFSSPPPHPPTSVSESPRSKASPAARQILPPVKEFENLKCESNSASKKELNIKETSVSDKSLSERKQTATPSVEVAKEVDDETSSTVSESTLQATVKSVEKFRDETPIKDSINANSNNSKDMKGPIDSGIHMNYVEDHESRQVIQVQPASQKISKLTAQNPTQVSDLNNLTKEDPQAPRATSASSSCSSSSRASSSNSSRKTPRPLPKCPVVSSAPKTKSERDSNLHGSWESVSSESSSVISIEDGAQKVSSARQRRRERNRKEKEKVNTPPIIEEIRKSRNSGLIGKKSLGVEKSKKNKSKVTSNSGVEPQKESAFEASGDSVFTSDRENSGQQPEIEEFMTLLHNTLQLANDKSKKEGEDSSSSSPSSTTEDSHGGGLSPVPEGTENSYTNRSASSQVPKSYLQNTPAATPISVPPVSNQSPHLPLDIRKHGVSQGTLRSTQRLMDRIVSLRRDCIQGLGVPLLHRAYEILDANEDEDVLRDELTGLLGEVRYDQWVGKIWQLKFCEESIFGHCGSITAY